MADELELIEAPYVERNGIPLMMTIVRKAGAKNLPVLMEIHGGGWSGGRRETQLSVMARDRAEEGYLYLNIDYRLAPFQPYPAATEDVQAAIDWIAQTAETYRGDPKRIGLFGFSAGGHLAALLALTSPVPISCAVSWGGPMDYRTPSDPEFTRGHRSCLLAFLGECHHDRPDLYRAISPTCHLMAQSPPLLIIHGECDDAVSWQHAISTRELAREIGAPVVVHLLSKAGHTDPGPFDPDGSRIWPDICQFLAKNLQPAGPIRPLSTEPIVEL